MSGGIQGYLKRMARRTGRKTVPKLARKSVVLPQEVQHAVDGASYVPRSANENGPRVMLSMVGLGRLIVQDTTDIEARILQAWPELSPAQVARVIRAISAGVAARIASASDVPGYAKSGWMDWKNGS